MAAEPNPLPNMGGTRGGLTGAVKQMSSSISPLKGQIDHIERTMAKMATHAKTIAKALGGATGLPGAANLGTGGVGASGGNLLGHLSAPSAVAGTGRVGSSSIVVAAASTVVAASQQPSGAPAAGNQQGFVAPTNGGANFGRGLGPPRPPGGASSSSGGDGGRGGGNGRRQIDEMYGGSFGNYLSHLGEQSAPFVIPNAVARMTTNVRQYAEDARTDNYIANRFAVSSGTSNTERFGRGMYRRMAEAGAGGSLSRSDLQMGMSIAQSQFTTQAVMGRGGGVLGGGRGGGMTIAGQATGLSQAMPGMGLQGGMEQLAKLNNPGIINMARAYGVQVRETEGENKGRVNFESVANGLIDRMYGPNPTANETDVGFSFQAGNASYTNLSQMGFDEESISNVRRIVEGRARTGWEQAQLGDSKAARDWRARAGLNTDLSRETLDKSDKSLQRSALTTEGEVSGLTMTNQLLGDIQGVLKSILAAPGIANATGAAGYLGGGLGGSPAAASAVSSAAGLGGNYMLMRGLLAMSNRSSAASGGAGLLARLGSSGAGLAAGSVAAGVAGGELGDYAARKAGVENKWGQAAAGAAGGAALGGALTAWLGPGALGGAALGGAIGGVAGYFAAGGLVPGNHNNDVVPIRATPGEVVIPTHTVKKHGGAKKLMDKLGFSGAGRNGDGYAKGGEVVGDTGELNAEFLRRLKAFSEAVGQPFQVNSGGRTFAEQQVLYDAWKAGKPNQAKAAKPGSSNHNYGLAADGSRWRDKNPEKYGLRYPMSYEPWHIEPTDAKSMRGGAVATGGDSAPAGGKEATSSVTGASSEFFTGGLGASLVEIMRNFGAPSGVSSTGSSNAATSAVSSAPTDPSGNAAIGKSKAASRGWKGAEWDALYALWQKESNWNHQADNPTSSAYGIPQALLALHTNLPANYYGSKTGTGSRVRATGGDPAAQIDWGLDYIAGRYGSPSKAWSFWQKNGSYSEGAWETKNEIAKLHQGEMVIPAKVADGVRTALRENGAGMPSRGGGAGTVNIYLTVARATDDEARRMAGLVKGYLENGAALTEAAMS